MNLCTCLCNETFVTAMGIFHIPLRWGEGVFEVPSFVRPALGKTAFRLRAKRVLQSTKAQRVAAACSKGLRAVCKEVIRVRGAATRG